MHQKNETRCTIGQKDNEGNDRGNEGLPPPSCDCLADPLLWRLVDGADDEEDDEEGDADFGREGVGVEGATGWVGGGPARFFREFTDRGRFLCTWANAILRVCLPHHIQKVRCQPTVGLHTRGSNPLNSLPGSRITNAKTLPPCNHY